MRRFISFLLVFAILSCALSAVSIEEPLVFTATIPNDYGVAVPEGVILLDRFAISAKTIEGVEALIREDTFHVGTINEAEPGSMDFVLMYYGNLPVSYDVDIAVDPGIGWYMYRDGDLHSMTIDVDYFVPENPDPSVAVGEENQGGIPVHIAPDGPKNGMPILGIDLSWEGERDIVPGEYQADIDIRVDVI